MITIFNKIAEVFPIRAMIRMALFSTMTLTTILFFTNWMERENAKSSFVNACDMFLMIMILNFISIFIIWFLYSRNLRSFKLTLCAFLLISLLGAFPMMLNNMLVVYLIKIKILLHDYKSHFQGRSLVIYSILQSALITYFIVTWQEFVLSQHERMRVSLENAALKIANSEAVNRLLLQQIHPHFLFNALTTIKSLIHRQPEVASNYLVKLSNFLRASMSSMKGSSATLTSELSFCSDYLELQKVRLGDALYYTIDISEDIRDSSYLPVFTLQLLTENAIKHNSFSEEEPMHIEISEADGIITVKNDYRPNYDKEHSMGSGLSNLSERYESLTGEKIIILTGQSYFYVSLKLTNSENYNHRR
ncbi:sensor histidine kinase [Pedobacter sp. L105]|uniref:sensor histidine kinase n=1 Tax=Pedobacter sp. L105 TaxID=1641871 RepID=UPI00131C3AC3|nr:histidine kinase [Pedobacter sp. L105]